MIASLNSSKKTGYSLIELMVVVTVLAILSTFSVPSIYGQNERFKLDNSANIIRQMILEAKIATRAPSSKTQADSAYFYQVEISQIDSYGSTLGENKQINTAYGKEGKTNHVSLTKGTIKCDTNQFSADSLVKEVSLPDNIFVSRFFPYYSQSETPEDAMVRFIVGSYSYSCGATNLPINALNTFESGLIWDPFYTQAPDGWAGQDNEGNIAKANALYIEVKSTKINESRFIIVDRLTSDVTISRQSPNRYFQPLGDAVAPEWEEPLGQSISVPCGATATNITLNFSRAVDYLGTPQNKIKDSTRTIYYDIDWSTDDATYNSLAKRFYFDITKPLDKHAVFNFTTSEVTRASPDALYFMIYAFDEGGNRTSERKLTFKRGSDFICWGGNGYNSATPIDAGSRASTKPDEPNTPPSGLPGLPGGPGG